MEPNHTQLMLFWTISTKLLTKMLFQTDFLLVMSAGQNWLPDSPNVNPCDYFLRGFLKENISPKYPETLLELRELIIDASNKIAEGISCHQQPGSSC